MNAKPRLDEGVERLLPAGPAAHLARLNRSYLGLVASSPEGQVPLAGSVLAGLRAARSSTLDAMAACCYALFALDPARMTLGVLPSSPAVHDPVTGRYGAAMPGSEAWQSFALEAVSFAWMLGRQSPLSVHLMLGLSHTVATSLAALDPGSLRYVADRQPLPLVPRWHSNPCFWPDLLLAASGEDALRMDFARLHGLQLLAADTQSSRVGRERACDSLRAP